MKLTPQLYLDRARRIIAEANILLANGLYETAGRTAYMTAFHAAQALICSHGIQPPKTHKGVHAEFYRIGQHDPRITRDLLIFPSQSYNLKAIADYEIGLDDQIDRNAAEQAVIGAQNLLATITTIIESDVA